MPFPLGAEMVPSDREPGAAAKRPLLTQALTTLVTQARMKTKGAQIREQPELPTGRVVSLLVTEGPHKGLSFPIQKPQVVIGRVDGDIKIADTQISRIHCVVEIHGVTALLVDLESGNGTFWKGKKVPSCEIDHMSEFRIGKTTLMFVVSGR